MKHKTNMLSWLCFALSLSILTSCTDEHTDAKPAVTRTVLFYLAADNNISSDVSAVVERVRSGWQGSQHINCLIYLDAAGAPPRLLRVGGGCANKAPYVETVAEYAEENSASAAVLARVVATVVSSYPAQSYGLVFASHASGWLPKGTLSNPTGRSLGADGNTGSTPTGYEEMELAHFAAALPDGVFDYIVFEACLMGGVEVAYELRNKCKYILASSAELLVPGFVPIYRESVMHLFNTSISTPQALTAFATDYERYIQTQSGAYRSMTLSVLSTRRLDELAQLVRESNPSAAVNPQLLQHFDRPGSYGDWPAVPRYFDFQQYMQQTMSASVYERTTALLHDVVVWKANTPTMLWGYNGFVVTHHSGLTTYVEQPSLSQLNSHYRHTAWYKATRE